MPRALSLSAVSIAALFAGACSSRIIAVESEPPGATVWLNDVEIGRTPCEVQFRHYGTYDLRLSKPGFEPIITSRTATAPPHEWVGLDLVTAPLPLTDRVVWAFTLTPVAESIDRPAAEAALVDRARRMRTDAGADPKPQPAVQPAPSQPPGRGPAGTPTTQPPSATPPSTTAPAPTTQP